MNNWIILAIAFGFVAISNAFLLGVPSPEVKKSISAALLAVGSLGFVGCLIAIATVSIKAATHEKK